MSTVFASYVPVSVRTLKPPALFSTFSTYSPSRISTTSAAYALRCFLSISAKSKPETAMVPIQFWISLETMDCPPQSFVRKTVLRRLRDAYTPAATPPGPPPIIAKSYIVDIARPLYSKSTKHEIRNHKQYLNYKQQIPNTMVRDL